MKIDRLLGIVTYLLNRNMASTRVLAERFEVSPRTIQRDMETLSLAGIPVGSLQGVNGGYYLADSFKLDRQLLGRGDFTLILTALKGLCSGYDNRQAEAVLEKLLSLTPAGEAGEAPIHLDLGVLREDARTGADMRLLEAAVSDKRVAEFDYTGGGGRTARRAVEPVALTYKWYAWYLFAYCTASRDYRLFRLSRMRRLAVTNRLFSREHGDARARLEEQQDHRRQVQVRLLCPPALRVFVEEAFPHAQLAEERDGALVMEFSVPDEERGWLGRLMEYGNQVIVLAPEHVRQRLAERAAEIMSAYR